MAWHRDVVGRLSTLAVVTALLAPASAPAAPVLVDRVLAAVGDSLVTASDVALARGLALFGFQPAATSITAAEVERMIRARLVVDEARRLDLVVEEAEVEAAWRALADRRDGSAALAAWLADNAIEPAWARGRLADHLRHERFLELRFRAFVFVLEEDISAALGPGEHLPAARDRAREQLRAEIVGRRLAEWLQEAARRTRIRRLLPADQEVPLPWAEALPPRVPSRRAGEDGESRRARPGVARESTQ
jgi:hypothetical protein